MRKLGTVILAAVGAAAAMLALSGGTSQVPRTPQGPAGMATPFLGVALLGSGGAAAAVDAYGSIVELRAPGPAGPPLISTGYKRQRAGSVAADTGIVLRAAGGKGALEPLWATAPTQRYVEDGYLLETRARLADVTVRARDAIAPRAPLLAREVLIRPQAAGGAARLEAAFNFDFGDEDATPRVDLRRGSPAGFAVGMDDRRVECRQESRVRPEIEADGGVVSMLWEAKGPLRISILCRFAGAGSAARAPDWRRVEAVVARVHAAATVAAHRTVSRATALSATAPGWAHRLYRRSLLTLMALTDRDTGAMPAGLRDHWHYIWPRDAGTAALALARAGLAGRAAKIARFISGLDVRHAARFNADGSPVEDGRHEQGDSVGWAHLARRAAGLPPAKWEAGDWRHRGDYGERDDDRGDYIANAIVAGAPAAVIRDEFGHEGLLVRGTDSAEPVLDTAAAWAVRPFARPPLYPLARRTLLELAATAGPFGLFPASDWRGRDPWTAATASTAWSLAALGERQAALRLMHAVQRAATPLGMLPERADIENGLPRSTTPLAWSHAFALLALRELWPS